MGKSISNFLCGLFVGLLCATIGFALYLRNAPQGAEGSRLVLTLGHSLDTRHPVHLGMVYMKERLEELSGGTATIDIYPSSVLGSEEQCIEQLQAGSLAMTKTSAAAMENFTSVMALFSLPYLFRDQEHYWNVLNSPLGQDLLMRGQHQFLRGLCYYDAGSRNFYTRNTPVRTPDDLRGLNIRVMASRTAMDMVRAFGAAPTPIAWGELYSALAQGTVDGAENNPPSFTSNRHHEVARHFTLNHHSRVPDILLISTFAWDRLSPQMQAWLQQAANESSVYQRELWNRMTDESLEIARQAGVTIHEVDVRAFAAKVQPMLDAVEDPEIRSLIQKIREMP
jgi:tripartite ATP-independent transporter DctP family solute receptor